MALFHGRRKLVLTLLRAGAVLKVLNHRQVNDRNVALNDYMIDIVNDGGWDAHTRKHHDLLLGVVSKCVQLPPEVMLTIASYWSLPH